MGKMKALIKKNTQWKRLFYYRSAEAPAYSSNNTWNRAERHMNGCTFAIRFPSEYDAIT